MSIQNNSPGWRLSWVPEFASGFTEEFLLDCAAAMRPGDLAKIKQLLHGLVKVLRGRGVSLDLYPGPREKLGACACKWLHQRIPACVCSCQASRRPCKNQAASPRPCEGPGRSWCRFGMVSRLREKLGACVLQVASPKNFCLYMQLPCEQKTVQNSGSFATALTKSWKGVGRFESFA